MVVITLSLNTIFFISGTRKTLSYFITLNHTTLATLFNFITLDHTTLQISNKSLLELGTLSCLHVNQFHHDPSTSATSVSNQTPQNWLIQHQLFFLAAKNRAFTAGIIAAVTSPDTRVVTPAAAWRLCITVANTGVGVGVRVGYWAKWKRTAFITDIIAAVTNPVTQVVAPAAAWLCLSTTFTLTGVGVGDWKKSIESKFTS